MYHFPTDSSFYSEHLKKIPFHKPEQAETIDRYADFVTVFTLFLIRMQSQPVDNFPISLHPIPSDNLARLCDLLSNGHDDDIAPAFHRFLFSLLSNPSDDFLSNQWHDPFLRFLIAFHLRDDHGTFARVILITPNLSKAQWSFRATCAREIELQKEHFRGDPFAYVFPFKFPSTPSQSITWSTYQAIIAPILTHKTPSIFNTLREQMGTITDLAHKHAGIPQFGWDPLNQTLSIHSHPLPMNRFIKSIHHVIDCVANLIDKLFRRTPYGHILAYIDSRLDPADPLKWFRDHPQNLAVGTSIFNEPNNHLEEYHNALLSGMVEDDFFFGFHNGGLMPKLGMHSSF
jgi:hypothetical protein